MDIKSENRSIFLRDYSAHVNKTDRIVPDPPRFLLPPCDRGNERSWMMNLWSDSSAPGDYYDVHNLLEIGRCRLCM